eukprot:maker-scaffold502_size153915-snap-gene-0.27 protein:Tk05905 transcript:maker-scaffold502_size153915-snap-gene-0.27-mRNA-1 annotation:"uracil-dna glycosylase"
MKQSVTWDDVIGKEKEQGYLKQTLDVVAQSRAQGKVIYPPQEDIFNAFCFTKFADVNVVILGQDPYHGPNQAHGLCFSVLPGIKTPPSLVNMYKELEQDIDDFTIPNHGYLKSWADQGVLLLNTVLTVEQGNANSHAHLGWETFTDRIIDTVNQHREGVVFLLWGAHARKKGRAIDRTRHHVLEGPHPSPLSAYRGFFGCKHFSATNTLLEEMAIRDEKPVNFGQIRDTVMYLQEYAEKYHHPKEDLIYHYYVSHYEDHEGVAKLDAEHEELAVLTAEFADTVEMILMDAVIPLDLFADRLNKFVEQQRSHLELEESSVLPAIEKTLTTDDWNALQSQWKEEEPDPLFAKTLDYQSPLPTERFTQPTLTEHSQQLIEVCRKLTPADIGSLMKPYRLEMGTKLSNERGSNLYQFWGEIITGELNDALEAQGDNLLVNLASNEYFKSVKPAKLKGQIITPVFKDCKKGQYKVISFYAKKARGMMARYIIDNRIDSVEALKAFDTAGYWFSAEESNDKELVFKREEQ